MASKRPRQPRHHRIDAACGHNFCYPAHKIIPMEGQNHLREMQRYVANVAITPSTFRKLGAGFVEAAQEFLASLNLKQLANLEPSEYPKWLEDQTQALMASFPLAERWGPARKSIIPRGRLDIEHWEPQRQRRGEQLASQRLK